MGRLKRQKAYRKTLDFYRMHFGIKRPYRVLLDGNFVHACVKNNINVRDRLATVLSDPDVDCQVPEAVIQELTAIGEPCTDALQLASTFKLARNRSSAAPKSAAEGILKLVGASNRHGYVVCSQDDHLRKSLNEIPGVPALYLNIGVTVLEPPSRSSREFNEAREQKKMAPRKDERRRLQRNSSSSSKSGNDDNSNSDRVNAESRATSAEDSVAEKKKKKKRQRGPKQPNPLSIRSKKRRNHVTEDSTIVKKKRRRRKSKEKM